MNLKVMPTNKTVDTPVTSKPSGCQRGRFGDTQRLNEPSVPWPAAGEGYAAKPDRCSAAVISRRN